MGRKDKYETNVKPRLPEIRSWVGEHTEKQIAKMLGISVSSFEKYKTNHPELAECLQSGKKLLIQELKDTLKMKAKGFHYTEKKKIIRNVDGKKTQMIEEYDRYSPPDTGAIHLLLKNLDDNWRNDDKTTVELKKEKMELERQKSEEGW